MTILCTYSLGMFYNSLIVLKYHKIFWTKMIKLSEVAWNLYYILIDVVSNILFYKLQDWLKCIDNSFNIENKFQNNKV